MLDYISPDIREHQTNFSCLKFRIRVSNFFFACIGWFYLLTACTENAPLYIHFGIPQYPQLRILKKAHIILAKRGRTNKLQTTLE